ncbi:MAG TPA: glycoside hydrolase family 9 protein, partial [Vicinamibacteria bacterium]|nr:glycoside hydrolase family 9 protein [Vicinamibacteria bacterium]
MRPQMRDGREPPARHHEASGNGHTPLGACVLLLVCLAPSARAASGYVRVNQLGYPVGASARAYLMATGAETGATFSVLDSGETAVYSAAIGESLGTWGTFAVYALDFHVSRAGLYRITVVGVGPLTSPRFAIGAPEDLYSGGLGNSLDFYQNERDGAQFVPTPLRTAPGHLNDASAGVYLTPTFDHNDNIVGDLVPSGAMIDAEGGWWDAGDYVKFVETTSYTVGLMLVGVRDFPGQMGAASRGRDFTREARFGLDWLQKMWDDESQTLYYQVGIGTGNQAILSDHDIWRLPQDDDSWGGSDPSTRYIRHRPVFIAGPAGSPISPNLAGRLAADFALCFQVFQKTDKGYADRCLLAAEHVFD